jgi:cellulose synthase (UDP-forming)
MRLSIRPPALFKSGPRPKVLPKEKTKTVIPRWVWAIFITSLGLFIGTFYLTSWTTTGPTILPIEQSLPHASLDVLINYAANPVPVGDRHIPADLVVPLDIWQKLQPLMIVVAICLGIRLLPSNNWTRLVIQTLIVLMGIRYMHWRTWSDTLNLTTGLTTALSLWLYGVELYAFLIMVITRFQYIWSTEKQRSAQADAGEAQIRAGAYLPSVDVYVPTYNEQEFIVRRTVLGCQALDYPNKKVYILDDSGRPHILALAEELGCGYITQPPGFINKHAKAGNLNNAYGQTDGELIAIFDADFVPFRNFLMRTVGFFQDSKVAVVQTPQDFYNPDHQARNLGLGHALPGDVQYFFQHYLSMADSVNAVICCGTSFLMRRSALEAVGGFYTRTIGEDSATSMRMLCKGYTVLCLNEKLSMGEAPRNYKDFINQRMRWLQSNMQIFLSHKDIPIFKTLNWLQRSHFLVMALGPLNSFLKATYMLVPLLCLYLGISGYLATTSEFLYYGAPYLLLMMGTYSWVCNYNWSTFYSELYDTMVCFPFMGRVFSTLCSPFNRGFKVTAKGVTADAKNYNLQFTWPLLVIIFLSVVMVIIQLVGRRIGIWEALNSEQYSLMFLWMLYNIAWLSLTVLAAIDQPEQRQCDRFPLNTPCKLSALRMAWGQTVDVSDSGAALVMMGEHLLESGDAVTVDFLEYNFGVTAEVVQSRIMRNATTVTVKFVRVGTVPARRLTEMLYSDLNWWKRPKRVGTLDCFLMMVGAVLKLKPLLTAYNRSARAS